MDEFVPGACAVVRLFKEDGPRRTYLLEKRDAPWERYVCKEVPGEDAFLLRQEYEILRSLPCRPDTLALREEDGVCRLLRDYVPGVTLAELIRRDGALSPPETARLGVKLCDTLGALHAMTPPVIHRDLKPENILLTETGRVRLIDFGAARTYKPGRDGDTAYLGTRGYAAPEQYGSGQTDVRTDIFALGKVLIYALAGDYADTPPALPGRDKALGRVLDRCCAYDPARRWPDTAALQKALERYLSRRALPVRGMAAAACVAVLCCAGALWGGYELGLRAPSPMPAAEALPGWDPFLREENVTDIVRLADDENWPALAEACEALVASLVSDPMIAATEPVAYWEMDEQALADYYLSRQGYEFIADRLAYGDHLAESRLGTYEAVMPGFALRLKGTIDYVITDGAGSTQTSALHMLVADGDDRNIDGCVLEIIGALDSALEAAPS